MKKILLTTFAITVLFSCKKEEEPISVTSPSTKGNVVLNAQFLVNGASYNSDSVYVDDFSNNYKISFSNVYLSQLNFEDGGVITPLPIQYVLLKPETSTYNLGSVEEGHYHNFNYGIGIDSATNHTDPNSYDLSSPLYPQSPNMHWTWNSGYIFYKIEGSIDTDSDGTFETTFAFHIGTDDLRRDGTFMFHDAIVAGATTTIDMKIDLGKFLTGIDLSIDNSTHTMNNMPLALRVANNATSAVTN